MMGFVMMRQLIQGFEQVPVYEIYTSNIQLFLRKGKHVQYWSGFWLDKKPVPA